MYHSNIGHTSRPKTTGVPSHNSLAKQHFSEPFKSGFITNPEDGPLPLLDLGSSSADLGPSSGNINVQDSYEGYGTGAQAVARWKTTEVIIHHIKENQTWPVKVFLPLQKTNHLQHEWQIMEFNPGLLDPLADEAAPRQLTFTRRQGKAYLRAFGKAISAEVGFHLTPEGQARWLQKMEALSSTVARSITIMALLELAQAATYNFQEAPIFVNGMPSALLRDEIIKEVGFFGALQKKRGGINTIISALKTILNSRGTTGDAVAFGLGTERYANDVTATDVSVHHSELIQITGGTSPEHQDGMSNTFGVGQYFMCSNDRYLTNDTARYDSSIATTQVYDMDAGLWVSITQAQVLRACGLFDYSDPTLPLTPDLGVPFFAPHRTWGTYLESVGFLNRYADLLVAWVVADNTRYENLQRALMVADAAAVAAGGVGLAAAVAARPVAGRVGGMPRTVPPSAMSVVGGPRSVFYTPYDDAKLSEARSIVSQFEIYPTVTHTVSENKDVYVAMTIALGRMRTLFHTPGLVPVDIDELVILPRYPDDTAAAQGARLAAVNPAAGVAAFAGTAAIADVVAYRNYATGGAVPGNPINTNARMLAALLCGIAPMAAGATFPHIGAPPAASYAVPSEAVWNAWVRHVVLVACHMVEAIQKKIASIRGSPPTPESRAILAKLSLIRQNIESTADTGTAAFLLLSPGLRQPADGTPVRASVLQTECDHLVSSVDTLDTVIRHLSYSRRVVAAPLAPVPGVDSRSIGGVSAPAAFGGFNRAQAIAMLFDSPIINGSFIALLDSANIPIPLNFLLVRPQVCVSASCAFIGMSGGAMGQTLYTGERFETGMDPVHSGVFGKLSLKIRPKVMDTRLLARINGVHINRYMFGGGTKLWHCNDTDLRRHDSMAGGVDRPSIFALALPLGENIIDRAISISGSLTGFIGADDKLHYSTAGMYQRYWGWSNRVIEQRRMLEGGISGPDFADASINNVVVTRGAHRTNRATGNGTWAMDEISSADSGHLGPTYPGCEAVMNGVVQYFENDRATV